MTAALVSSRASALPLLSISPLLSDATTPGSCLMMRPAIRSFSLTPRLAIALVFLIRGFIVGSWFPRIPGIIEKLGTSSSEMGLVWFSVAVMNIVAFSIAARIMRRFGSARSYLCFALPYPLAFVLAGLAPTIPAFWGVMLLFGLLNGGFDVSASVQGGIVERATRKPLFSALYGYFSLGALVGSFFSGIIAQEGIPASIQFSVIAVVAIPLFLLMHTRLLPDEQRPTTTRTASRRFALPPRALVPLGVTIICVGLGEESINNWVALYMRSDLGSNAAIAGFAYTAFSIATFLGRIVGDRVIARFGIDRVLSTGSVMAAGGIAFGILVNQPWAMVAGYTVVGAGLSIVVPVTYRRAGEVPGMSPADAVSRVATIGFIGFMFGPILIGVLSDLVSLRFALGTIAVGLLGIMLMVRMNPHGERSTVEDHAPASAPS
jgi:MFS family permease